MEAVLLTWLMLLKFTGWLNFNAYENIPAITAIESVRKVMG